MQRIGPDYQIMFVLNIFIQFGTKRILIGSKTKGKIYTELNKGIDHTQKSQKSLSFLFV